MNARELALEEITKIVIKIFTGKANCGLDIGCLLMDARDALALPEENPWINLPQIPKHINWVEITIREYINDEWKKMVIPAFYENGGWWEWPDERLYFQKGVIEFVCWREMPTPGP